MANRYWVGNGGNISDTAHWSATSGGAGGASVPTSADNAYWDPLSFTLTGQIVTVDAAFTCLDMDWTGATNTPTLARTSGGITLNGSLTFIAGMIHTATNGIITMVSSGSVNLTAPNPFPWDITFNGDGTLTLQTDLNTTLLNDNPALTVLKGTFNSNNKNITIGRFVSSSTTIRNINLTSSTVTIKRSSNTSLSIVSTNLTFNAGTSTIIMSGNAQIFAGGGLAYNNVTFSGTSGTISGSNTFNTLKENAGCTLNLTSGTTQTITNPVFNGTAASPSALQSVTAGSPATIALPAGRYFIRHTSIKDITITGATSVTSIAGTNVSGNTGITFVAKFEMGRIKNDGSFNWYNTTTGTVTKVSG